MVGFGETIDPREAVSHGFGGSLSYGFYTHALDREIETTTNAWTAPSCGAKIVAAGGVA